jgi:ABC-2 type transport system ATP-binding protein
VTTEEYALLCRGLRYQFGETVAVDGVDLAVARGEIFGLLGPNGAGKTTTIRAITALLPVPPGTISVFGLDVARRKMAVRRLVGYVPQMLSADGSLTGRENVALFARLFDVPRRSRTARVNEAIEAMGLGDAADRLASTYSGGMVRRLELAQALVSSPRLLILDEPTIGLDPVARAGVWERITAVRRETGMTVLVTTHYMDEAEQSCDRVALMHRGRVRAIGTPDELIAGLDVPGATLDDVFRAYSGADLLEDDQSGGFRDVRATRRTARRLG